MGIVAFQHRPALVHVHVLARPISRPQARSAVFQHRFAVRWQLANLWPSNPTSTQILTTKFDQHLRQVPGSSGVIWAQVNGDFAGGQLGMARLMLKLRRSKEWAKIQTQAARGICRDERRSETRSPFDQTHVSYPATPAAAQLRLARISEQTILSPSFL